jgi:hypothetical protein
VSDLKCYESSFSKKLAMYKVPPTAKIITTENIKIAANIFSPVISSQRGT